MVKVGQRVRFIPFWNTNAFDTEKTKRAKTVTGVVTIVNYKHRVFWCEYEFNGVRQIETFNFSDIGVTVSV